MMRMRTARQRYTIALYISETDNDYSRAIYEGVCEEAEKCNINLVVFTVKYLDAPYVDKQHNLFSWMPNCLLSYAMNKSVDAVILDAGSIGANIGPEAMKVVLNRYTGVPVISIAKQVEGYPCLNFNADGIKTELRHLYEHHGCRKIAMMNGPLSTSDAIARFEAYKEALAACGLPFDPRRVGEGKFTKLDDAYVEQMLAQCDYDVDAVMFANDDMAIAGYRVLEKHGLKVGKDVLVTGFDDALCAMDVDPPLTTIRTDIRKLGAQAVENVLSMIENGHQVMQVPESTLVLRGSCGCKSIQTSNDEKLELLVRDKALPKEECRAYLRAIVESCMISQLEDDTVERLLTDFFSDLLEYAAGEAGAEAYDILLNQIQNNFNYQTVSNVNAGRLFVFLAVLRKRVLLVAADLQRASNTLDLIDQFSNNGFDKLVSMRINMQEKQKRAIMRMQYFMGIAISSRNDKDYMYREFLFRINEMGIRNAYFYMHEEMVRVSSFADWQQPQQEVLYAYCRDGEITIVPEGERMISADMLFKHRMLPDARTTFFAAPLCFAEESYGFLIVELELQWVDIFVKFISTMLSDAIKFSEMYAEQVTMMKLMENDLHKTTSILREIQGRNENLNRLSKFDEMTGILNRRGFLEETNLLLSNADNYGKKAAVIFADMDDLKKVNDRFGHAEGDIAIKTIAKILSLSLRGSDIIARFGGDEFAAFAMFEAEGFAETFTERVKQITTLQNREIDKPYYVSASLGIHVFEITAQSDLNTEMQKADGLLYEDKRRRKKGRI